MQVPEAEDLRRRLDDIVQQKAAMQRKLVLEERRLDVLARILGYEVYPFHWMLIQAKLRMQKETAFRLYLAPRGSGKSTILTVVDSVMDGLVYENVRVLIVSRAKDQAKDILSEIQGCFVNDHFMELFGDLRGDKWGTGECSLSNRTKVYKEPTFLAAGADGPVTSKHFDKWKVDDLCDEKNSRTDGEKKKLIKFMYKTLGPTLIKRRPDGSPGEVDMLGTRYDPDDLYGHVIEKDPRFAKGIFVVPALVDPETGDADTNNGVSIVPEILPTNELKIDRIAMGSANFDSQYQQDTSRMKGEIFDSQDFRHYTEDPKKLVKEKELKVWAACDLAIGEDEEHAEYADVVIGVDDRAGIDALDVYVLEIFHKKCTYTAQIARAAYIFAKWGPIRFGIEANAFQKSRLKSVYRELGEGIGDRCVPVFTLIDKVTRAWKLSARFEAGRIFTREGEHDDLEGQLVGFPNLKLKDLFDALDFSVTLGCVQRAKKRRKRKVGIFGRKERNLSVGAAGLFHRGVAA